jgi:hypothetical protein
MLYIIDLTNIPVTDIDEADSSQSLKMKKTIPIAKRGTDFVAKSEITRIGNRTYEKSINSNCTSTGRQP